MPHGGPPHRGVWIGGSLGSDVRDHDTPMAPRGGVSSGRDAAGHILGSNPRDYASVAGFSSVWEPVTLLVFFAYVTAPVARSLLRPGRVDLDRMATAVSGSLLLALSWSLVYLILSMTDPGAFRGPGDLVWSDFIYLSFPTIPTLGYGDVVPATSQARTLATFEALVGVFFVATLVARFASLYERADRHRDTDPGAG